VNRITGYRQDGELLRLYYNLRVGFGYVYTFGSRRQVFLRRPRSSLDWAATPPVTNRMVLNSRPIGSTEHDTIKFKDVMDVLNLRRMFDCPGLTDMPEEDFEAVLSDWERCLKAGVVPGPKNEELIRTLP